MNNDQDGKQNESRQAPRRALELDAIIRVTGADGQMWSELASITTVSRTGVGFIVSQPCTVGRLVSLVLPMPKELRAYDHDAELYPVMALIQNCYRSTETDEDLYHIGAALIGKDVPESYRKDPCQDYRIGGMGENGLWKAAEVEHAFKKRKHQRYWKQLKVTLTLLQTETKTTTKESAVTQNIAAKGASVVSDLDARVGDKVKFMCKDLNFFAIAVVRARKKAATGNTLHIEFIDAEFPIDALQKEVEGRLAAAVSANGNRRRDQAGR